MACRNIVSISSTMQPQKHHTIKKQSPPERISTYKPNIWKYDHLLSLTSQYSEGKHKVEAEKLKEEVSCEFSKTSASSVSTPVTLLELIDRIDKLGLTSYFEVETKEALEKIIMYMKSSGANYYSTSKDQHLYAIALCFRLLREHGYPASQDMLKDLFDGKEKLASDMKTLLELLEGSYLSMDGESLLDDIRVRWYDVRRHIDAQKVLECNMLKLAKLNFNITQAAHQKDLKDVIRWWSNLCIVEDLNFTRDRIVESFFFAVGIASEPQHGSLRKWLTKVIQLVLIIDDVYDIYGSLADVQQFTRALDKWDSKEVQQLPECIRTCFRALHDTTEEISIEIQQQTGGPSALPHLKQAWVNFCKALLVEKMWCHKGHIPTLEEYLDNGWTSSSGPLLSIHVIFGLSNKITNETLDLCKSSEEIIYHTSVIIRLCNDHGTSTAELERGDVASSIICYMQEKNVSGDVAREHIEGIILNSWKKINYHFNILPTSHQKIVKHVINGARMAHVMYHSGDGFGVQDGETQDQVLINLIEPII